MAEKRMGNINSRGCSPEAPPVPGLMTNCKPCKRSAARGCCVVTDATRDLWDKLFAEGYQADVFVCTNEGVIPAHASILGTASPVMKNMLRQSRRSRGGRRKAISIRGVPHHAVRVFLRFLYSSCYEQEEMNQFVLHLLVLSHVFVIPTLKNLCVQQLERGLLTTENVVDVFQLARLFDAPRLCLLCHRMIVRNFEAVSASEGWKVMKQSNPRLEKELLESVIDADTRKNERLKKLEERKIYLQLHEAMEALVHICRDGCRTIGPHDKVLRRSADPCNFPACRGLEALVRHFAGCKNRVLGGCTHCKRMWQLLELHSRLCSQVDGCKVPLCRHFKEKLRHQNKKDEVKWKLLVSKVLEAKSFSGAPFLQSMVAVCA
ncbi:BTB/POZ and TAZ domain-containing protein 4-like [Phoenix dactylifera]|uniref:BTB/POZ and TAZ domain-containing protein 4-like n=1 Tax=Phoenix dactylifera TaxID=42345 RepID=A0A8B7CSZ7_PHODC|nr:BTB/POZ and TAZ domain-containing protein 4-like [Phoenix dactylifera]XP_026664874.1 BTB/POZ and TAZ domain-containing protein 4-like [Phoenix dactylifera]